MLQNNTVLIEVCDANRACIPELFELEREFPYLSILEIPCMSQCELCQTRAFVFLNSNLVDADGNVAQLLECLRYQVIHECAQSQDNSM